MIGETVAALKDVAAKTVEMTIEAAKKEVAKMPEKIGKSSEVERLPNKLGKGVESVEGNLEQLLQNYFYDLKSCSECPDTLPSKPFDISNLEKLSPEATAKRRDDFADVKPNLKNQWEQANGMGWPKYTSDVYSANGKLIRKEGQDYDAHHIQPLCMGGKNVSSNITPLHAEVHYDKQGIHAADSTYSTIDKLLGGAL